MSLVLAAGSVAALLLASALWSRRPSLVGTAGGLLVGPVLYYLLGGHLAEIRGEGRFYSFPFGGYRIGDTEILLSLGSWMCVTGVTAYAIARLVARRPTRPISGRS